MGPLEVFSIQDLEKRSEDLVRGAEQGRLSVITQDGRPVILALPFDERLLTLGVHRALALSLFEAGQTSLAQSARIAGVPLVDFLDLLAQAGIPAVDYPAEDLDRELEVAARFAR